MNNSLLLFLLFAGFIAINVPIAIALGAAAVIVGFIIQGDLGFVPSVLFSSVQKIELLAIPFFILAGHVFDRSGIMVRMFRLVDSMIGRVRGSTSIVTSALSVMIGGISGSGPADTAALGSTLGPVMVDRGYSKSFTGALIAAGGSLGLVVPPSIAYILYGVVVPGISISQMFVAGILPGIMMGGLIGGTAYYLSVKRGYDPGNRAFSLGICWLALRDSAWGLMAPIVIVGGIYFGIFTPTEAAGVAVVYGVLVGWLIYGEIRFKQLIELVRAAALDTAAVMLIVACASLFSWVFTVDGTLVVMVQDLSAQITAPWQLFIATTIVLLIAGMFIDGASIYLVLVPLLIPAARGQSVDLIWFGVFVAVNVAIGQFTPPVGVNLFVAARVLKVEFDAILKDILPFVGACVVGLIILYLVPGLSKWLPATMSRF